MYSFTAQVASGFEVNANGVRTEASPGSVAFPVIRMSASSFLMVHAVQEKRYAPPQPLFVVLYAYGSNSVHS